MARGNEGWDFVKVGQLYQYKEDSLIAIVRIVEDNSTDEEYCFVVEPIASSFEISKFTVMHNKKEKGYYSGMCQFFEESAYAPLPPGTDYTWTTEEWANLDKETKSRFMLFED